MLAPDRAAEALAQLTRFLRCGTGSNGALAAVRSLLDVVPESTTDPVPMPPRQRTPNQARKKPASSKGHAIVNAIVEAARFILDEDGYDGLTSNRIAERAGVSIGSFYQYFPNREAVVAELARSIERQTLALFEQRVGDSRGDPLKLVDHAIDILVSNALGGRGARAQVLLQVPRGWTQHVSREVDERVNTLVEQVLIAHSCHFPRIDNPRVSAFMLVSATESIVENCIERHPEWIESGELRSQLRTMVVRYLGVER